MTNDQCLMSKNNASGGSLGEKSWELSYRGKADGVFAACFIAIFFFPVLLAGCQSLDDQNIQFQHQLVRNAHATLLSEKQELFTSSQLKAMLGEPGKILTVSNFFTLLAKTQPAVASDLKQVIEKRLSANACRLLAEKKKGESENLPANQPAKMTSCRIWIYHWHKPVDVCFSVVGGTILLPTSRTVREKGSYFYIVDDKARVIGARYVKR